MFRDTFTCGRKKLPSTPNQQEARGLTWGQGSGSNHQRLELGKGKKKKKVTSRWLEKKQNNPSLIIFLGKSSSRLVVSAGGCAWPRLELRNNGRAALAGHVANITAVRRVVRAEPRCETDDGETDESSGCSSPHGFPSRALCTMPAGFCCCRRLMFISKNMTQL